MNPRFINNLSNRKHLRKKEFIKVTGKKDPRALAEFINCLSMLENDAARLYNNLSVRVENPVFKSLLFAIAQDSTKHGALLKGVADSLIPISTKHSNCVKTGEPWRLVANLNKEIEEKTRYSGDDFLELSGELAYVESILGEEYYMFVQMKTLERMIKEINQIYRIDLGSLKSIFTHIINDEERHREIIETMRSILERQEQSKKQKVVEPPVVKYTNPDNWIPPFFRTNAP
jgi:rubrerythrin